MNKNAFDQFDTNENVFDQFDNQSSPYVPMSQASSLPPMWSPRINGQKVNAVYDPQAKAYLTTDQAGNELMVVRHPDGGLMLSKYKRPQYDPTQDMGSMERAAAGAGKAIYDTGRGARQISKYVGNLIGLVDDKQLADEYANQEQIEKVDEPLMQTIGGNVGYAGGLVGTSIVPGAAVKGLGLAAKGAGAARVAPVLDKAGTSMIVPKSYKGAAAIGATQGLVLPSTSDIDRGENAVIGAAGGVVGQGVGNLISKSVTKGQSANLARAEAEAIRQGQRLPNILDQQTTQLLIDNGIDPRKLSREVQRGLSNIVANEPNLTPEALVRIARAQSLSVPVNLTHGAAMGDFKRQQAESMLELMPGGEALRAQKDATNAALAKNMEKVMRDQLPTATDPYHVGKSVQQALKNSESASIAKVSQMYDKADASGQQYLVDPAPMVAGLMKNFDAIFAGNDAAPAKQMAGTMQRMGLLKINPVTNEFEPTGNLMTAQQAMELYKAANQSFVPGTVSSRHISDFKRGILQALDQTPAGGDFRKATNAFKAHAQAYDNPRMIASLLATNADEEPKIAAERVFDAVAMRGSIDDINLLKKTLLSSDKTVRDQGLEALRNIRGMTAQYLLEKSFSGNAINATGDRIVSGINLLNAVKTLGGGLSAKNEQLGWMKVQAIMGKKATDELKAITSTALDATRRVSGADKTSGTAERIISALGSMPMNLSKPLEIGARMITTGAKTEMQRKEAKAAVSAVSEMMKKKPPVVPGSAIAGSALGSTLNR